MADISKIKLPDGVTYNIKDSSTEIGGRNLLVGSYKYTNDNPFVNTTTVTDGYKYLSDVHTVVQVHTGENCIIQAKTDGDWSTRHGEQPTNFVTLWLVGSANVSPLTTDLHQVFLTTQNTNPNYLGDGKWLWTIPSNWDGKYIYIRVNNYNTDGTTSVTHTYWDFKLEKGSKATDWSLAPEDQIAGSGTSGCIAKFNGANTVTNGPAFGSSITNFLAENGQWRTPTDNKVRQNYIEDTVEKSYMLLLGEHDATYSEYMTTETVGTKKAIGLDYCIKNGTSRKLMISATDGSETRSVELVPLGTSIIPRLNTGRIYNDGDIYSEGDIFSERNIECDGTVSANSVTANSVTLPHQYSETEQIVGYWIDGNPIYEKTIRLSSIITIASNSNTAISTSYWSQTAKPIDLKVYRMTQAGYQVGICTIAVIATDGKLTIYNTRQGSLAFDTFTIQYIKT